MLKNFKILKRFSFPSSLSSVNTVTWYIGYCETFIFVVAYKCNFLYQSVFDQEADLLRVLWHKEYSQFYSRR